MDLIPDYGVKVLTIVRDLMVRLIGVVIFSLLAWRAWIRSDDAVLFTEATNMIGLPFSPFFIILAAASTLQVLVLSVEIFHLLSGTSLVNATRWTDVQEDAPPSR